MAVPVECPYCGEERKLHIELATSAVRCPGCCISFVPVEDSEVPCPRCGSHVSMPFRNTGRRVTCLECGLVIGESRSRQLREFAVFTAIVALGIPVFATVLLLALFFFSSPYTSVAEKPCFEM